MNSSFNFIHKKGRAQRLVTVWPTTVAQYPWSLANFSIGWFMMLRPLLTRIFTSIQQTDWIFIWLILLNWYKFVFHVLMTMIIIQRDTLQDFKFTPLIYLYIHKKKMKSNMQIRCKFHNYLPKYLLKKKFV